MSRRGTCDGTVCDRLRCDCDCDCVNSRTRAAIRAETRLCGERGGLCSVPPARCDPAPFERKSGLIVGVDKRRSNDLRELEMWINKGRTERRERERGGRGDRRDAEATPACRTGDHKSGLETGEMPKRGASRALLKGRVTRRGPRDGNLKSRQTR